MMYGAELVYLVEFSICLIVFMVLFGLLFKEEKCFTFNRFYLLLVPVVSILIPKIHYTIHLSNYTQFPQVYIPDYLDNVVVQQSGQLELYTTTIHWQYLIWVVYLCGVLLSLIKLGNGFWRYFRFTQQVSGTIDNGIKKIYVAGLDSPYSIFKTIVLPKVHDNLDFIEQHELSHCRHKHTWDVIYYELLLSLLWFHPCIYLLRKWLKEQHEYIADSDVIRDGQSKYLYASSLVNQSTDITKSLVPFANHFNSITIKKRLKMIAKKENQKMALAKTTLVIPVLLLMVFSFSIQVNISAQESRNYEKDKVYSSVEKNDAESRAKQVQKIIADYAKRGKTLSEKDIVLIPQKELGNIMKSMVPTTKGQTAPDNMRVRLVEDNSKIEITIDGKPVTLVSNKLVFTRSKEEYSKEMETYNTTMQDGILPSEFRGAKILKHAMIGVIKIKDNNKIEVYDDFFIDITKQCK